MSKNLIIRADANIHIGTGHVMRCQALAQAWQDRGGKVTFLSHCDSEALHQRIIDEGFEFIPIEKPHPDSYDLGHTLEILEQLKIQNSKFKTWVVIDGYHFTPDYQKAIRENGYKLLVIDDMAHLNHYHADILLNQNIHASSLNYSCRDMVKLLGCEYVLLRRKFLKHKDWKREIPERAKKILVTMGGADPDNVTLKVIRTLNSFNDSDFEVKIVAGPANPNISSLEKELYLSPFTVHLLSSVSNMPELMAWADVAVSAGGSTCWEMAFMGLPNAILILAENQRRVAEDLDDFGVAINIGWHTKISRPDLLTVLEKLIIDSTHRRAMSERGPKLVDGSGVGFVLTAMKYRSQPPLQEDHFHIRLASLDDIKLLWHWANDPNVRANSFNPQTISMDDHVKWFKKKLTSPDTRIWILELNQVPVAQIRYDRIQEDTAEIDFSVVSEYCGKGFGQKILKLTTDMACDKLGVTYLRGVVLNNNKSSAGAFAKAGFVCNGPKQVKDKFCHIYAYIKSDSSEEGS